MPSTAYTRRQPYVAQLLFTDDADWPPMQAAGLLPRFTDAAGEQWFLLAKRGRHCRSGGVWANFGGELDRGETPLAAAAREFCEETGLPLSALAGATIGTTIESSHRDVDYTLFILDVPVQFGDVELTWENDDCWWFNAAGVDELPLHHGFARSWAALHGGQ